MLSATEDKKQPLETIVGAHSEHLESLFCLDMGQEQQAPGQNDPKQPWQGAVLTAAEEGKNSQGHLLAHVAGEERGKAFLPPAAEHERRSS